VPSIGGQEVSEANLSGGGGGSGVDHGVVWCELPP